MRTQTSVLRMALALVLGTLLLGSSPAMAAPQAPDTFAFCTHLEIGPESEAGITPYLCTSHVSCASLAYQNGWRIGKGSYADLDDGKDFEMTRGWSGVENQHGFPTQSVVGSPPPAGARVRVTSQNGVHFGWSSNLFPIAAVIVKDKVSANEYVYVAEDEIMSDSDLAPVLEGWGGGIKEIQFCWNTGATYVELDSFTAKPVAEGIALEWATTVEVDNAGFNLYRSQTADGVYEQVNSQLIASTGNATGDSYSYTDATGSDTHYYVLEDVDFAGKATRHGPVRVQAEGARVMSQGAFLPIVSVQ